MERYASFVVRHARTILVLVLLASLLPLYGLIDFDTRGLALKVDPSINQLLPKNDPDRLYFERVREVFGGDDQAIVVLGNYYPLSMRALQVISTLTGQLETLPGVRRVASLSTVLLPRVLEDTGGADGGTELLSIAQWMENYPGDADHVRERLLSNPLYRDVLIAADARSSALIVDFEGISDQDFLSRGIVQQIRDLATASAPDAEVWITGAPVVRAEISRTLADNQRQLLPLIVGLVAGLLMFAFRSVRGVLLPMIAIGMAVLWTLGTLAWTGQSLNLVTALVAPVIVTLGLAYAMHVLSEYYAGTQAGVDNPVEEMLRTVTLPMLLTGLTTAAGFMALMLNPLTAVREFSLLSTIGVFYAVATVLLFLPAALVVFGCGRAKAPPGEKLFDALAAALSRFNTRHRTPIILLGMLLLIPAFYGASKIEVGTEYIRGFSPDAPVRHDFEAINTAFGGAHTLSIVIEAYVDDAFTKPVYLEEIADLQAWLEGQPEIGSTTSVVDYLTDVAREYLEEGERFSQNERLNKQLLVFSGSEALEKLVDSNFHTAHLIARANVDDTRKIADLLGRVRERLTHLREPLNAQVTGTTVLVTSTVDDLVRGQTTSFGVALVVVYLMLAALFTSHRAGLMALLPNIIPVAFYFGMLGFAGVTLNPTTSLIATIALGIAVDDTLHYLARFNANARSSGAEEGATHTALRAVLRPVTLTSLALVLGFLVLTFSDLRNQVQFGALAAATLFIAWVTDVTFTPALASRMRIVTLWDVLRLDLGHAPQKSIPLFHGLNVAQARTFALMSEIMERPRGTRIIAEGERGDDMFVVIEGELEVWVNRDDKHLNLTTMRRGNVIGEVGFFAQRRTANVDAMTDVRLLRFNAGTLEQLRKRRPRIASTVYRNLARAQAERLARTTELVK